MLGEREKRTILSLTIWDACNNILEEGITDEVLDAIFREGMLKVALVNAEKNSVLIKNKSVLRFKAITELRYKSIINNMNDFLAQIGDYNYVNFKGPVLNHYVYEKIGCYRLMGDCDILVHEKDALSLYKFVKSKIKDVYLTDNEDLVKYYIHYLQHLPGISYRTFHYEIHHRLNQLNEPYPIKHKYMFIDTVKEGNFVFPCFGMFFISMCQHVFRHEYFEATFKWRNICDIINIILVCSIDWENISKLVDKVTSKFVMFYVLTRAQTVYKFVAGIPLLSTDVINLFSSDYDKELDDIVFKTYHPESNGFYYIGKWSQGYLERLFKGAVNDINRNDLVSIDFNYQFVRRVQYDNMIRQCKEIGVDFDSFKDSVIPVESGMPE